MKRRSFFGRLVLYVSLACVLTSLVGGFVSAAYSFRREEDRTERELRSRASAMAFMCNSYLEGRIVFDNFSSFFSSERDDVRMYLYDAQGSCVLFPPGEEGRDVYHELAASVLLSGTAKGERKGISRSYVLGWPLTDCFSRVYGVLVLSKPVNHSRTVSRELLRSTLLSIGITLLFMIPVAYFGSKRAAKPVRQITAVADAMAAGDFSVRAKVEDRGEVGRLGESLNALSEELSETIGNLTLARERFHSILEGIGDGVLTVEQDLKTVGYSNPAAEELLTVFPNLLEQNGGALQAVLNTGEPRILRFAAGEKVYRIICSPYRERVNAEPGLVLLCRDETEEDRLEQTRRDYVANVSHELKTPVASIRSLAESLCDGMAEDEETKQRYYGYILRESMRLSRLIGDLLELSRIQSGAVTPELTEIDASEPIRQVTERMAIPASESGIELRRNPLPRLLCRSNRDRLEQVLVILVDNAIKYAADGGRILIDAAQQGSTIAISVRNTGHIDEESLPRLFERFYKADKSHSGNGTGLGLAIAKELMTLLGGGLEAMNDGEDAVFTLTVPAAEPENHI